ncbi:GntR family transcriptional regulator [Salsipaludibacter albus]|uniref:GntR family transcriptional regulator n=1 Tax=Salsipaludibacter albus TaxID=2849650 RepID=UPI001EE41037|nr:GntR family transcriptional regulator [Salsipaludibacter albus]MBY5162380.1 GntR family transcriptional regulator [Salsipaludibacter albus]
MTTSTPTADPTATATTGASTGPDEPPRTQADLAEDQLRDLLVTLQVRPGEPLREAALMERLGVGRTPLREAVNRLAVDGLVVVHPRRGTFASDVNIGDLALLTDLRAQLEGLAAARAAERATPAERERLATLVSSSAAGAEPLAAMRHDHAIHQAIWAATHNPFLARTAARHHSLSTRIWYLFVDRLPHVPDHVDELRSLVDQIVAGDADAARATATAHVRHFETAVTNLW